MFCAPHQFHQSYCFSTETILFCYQRNKKDKTATAIKKVNQMKSIKINIEYTRVKFFTPSNSLFLNLKKTLFVLFFTLVGRADVKSKKTNKRLCCCFELRFNNLIIFKSMTYLMYLGN